MLPIVLILLTLVVIMLAARLIAGKESVALGRKHCSHNRTNKK